MILDGAAKSAAENWFSANFKNYRIIAFVKNIRLHSTPLGLFLETDPASIYQNSEHKGRFVNFRV